MMIKKNMAILFGTIILLSGCSDKPSYELLQSENEIVNEKVVPNAKVEYKILPQDRLSIDVYKYPELAPSSMQSKGILVDSNGYVYLPLIHRVKVAGLNQSEAARLLEDKYKVYLTDPALHLEVMNKRVYVLGEVKKPGVIALDKEKLSILEAIAFAGDLTDSAVRDNILILSHNAKNEMTLRKVDLTSYAKLRSSNILIKPNDVIYVQPSIFKQYRVHTNDLTAPFETITKIASPFVTLKFLDL